MQIGKQAFYGCRSLKKIIIPGSVKDVEEEAFMSCSALETIVFSEGVENLGKNEFFDCDCCGKNKSLAGSIQYGDYRLCNDCVLLAETGFALKKFTDIQDLMNAMEDKRLEELCKYVKEEENRKKQLDN